MVGHHGDATADDEGFNHSATVVAPRDRAIDERNDMRDATPLGPGPVTAGGSTAPAPTAHPDLFRATLDAVPDAVVVVDARGVIVTANTQVEAVFGYRPDELEQQLVEVLVPPRLRADHPRRRSGYTRRPMGLLQLSAVRRDGTEFPAEISLAPSTSAAVPPPPRRPSATSRSGSGSSGRPTACGTRCSRRSRTSCGRR
ncbi:PAS domain S-box protein [Nocardioides zeae]